MKCQRCSKYELYFDRGYAPEKFLWGKKSSQIWIVGLNPKERLGYSTHTVDDLERYFDTDEKTRSYFKDFGKVSPKLFEMLGKDKGVAHTDIVKCFSNKFPPEGCSTKEAEDMVDNCSGYFEKQLQRLTPKLIICNGRAVCDAVIKIIEPPKSFQLNETSYCVEYNGNKITVVLCGFIGRIDNYSKRRLGLEIEHYVEKLGIA